MSEEKEQAGWKEGTSSSKGTSTKGYDLSMAAVVHCWCDAMFVVRMCFLFLVRAFAFLLQLNIGWRDGSIGWKGDWGFDCIRPPIVTVTLYSYSGMRCALSLSFAFFNWIDLFLMILSNKNTPPNQRICLSRPLSIVSFFPYKECCKKKFVMYA